MRRYILALFILLLTACGDTNFQPSSIVDTASAPSLIQSHMATPPGLVVSPAPSDAFSGPNPPTSTRTPSSPSSIRPQYTLITSLDYAAHHVVVEESIRYQNDTSTALTDLVLAVEPNLWKGCFNLQSLIVDGQSLTGYILNDDRLEIPLLKPLIPGGALDMTMHFELNLPAADSHHVFGHNDLQLNLVDWYPFIVPYSNGWLLHPPADVGEHLVYDTADFDVTLKIPSQSTPVTVAASSLVETNAGTMHYHLDNARTFVLSASSSYRSLSVNSAGVIVTSYYFQEHEAQAKRALAEVAKAVTTFTALFGQSGHGSLSMVESPFFDGLEFDGLFFLSRNFYARYDGTVLNDLIDIAVHETAHQWWFGSVGNDQALEPWLDEAIATYSERLFYEMNYPEVAAWWAFRVEPYSPAGWVDMDIYHGINFRTYANAVYLRGAQFLEAIRNRVGDEAFFVFLKDYATQMSGKRSSAGDFFRILHLHTNVDLTNLVSTYFQKIH
jgi:hypothetical protein